MHNEIVIEWRHIGTDVATTCEGCGEIGTEEPCCQGRGRCPVFPRAKTVIHREFADPSRRTGTDEEIMGGVRRIRDEIRARIDETLGVG